MVYENLMLAFGEIANIQTLLLMATGLDFTTAFSAAASGEEAGRGQGERREEGVPEARPEDRRALAHQVGCRCRSRASLGEQ